MALADVPVELIERCRREERSALEELFKLISPDLYRITYHMLRDPDSTDEVVQETFVRLFRHIKNLQEVERFASWTMRIAVNQVQTWRVRNRRRRLYQMDEAIEPDPEAVVLIGQQSNPRRRSEQIQIREHIEQAMKTLPDRQQMAITLFELEGHSIKEIAEVMDCSEGAVKFNLHEARKKLRGKLTHLVKAEGWDLDEAQQS